MKKLLRWAFLTGGAGVLGYWAARYFRPEQSTLSLRDQVVIVTGASSGIGRALANAFARRGARIVLAARREAKLEAVRHEIAPYAADVLVVPTDVRQEEDLRRLVALTTGRFGGVDILINNAGLLVVGMLHRNRLEDLRAMVETNFTAAVELTALCLPSMLARRSGWVVNVASTAGRIAMPNQLVYGAVKHGLIDFGDSLRRQLDGTGVRVLSVMPTFTSTDMVPPRAQRWARSMGFRVDTPEYVAERVIDSILKGQHQIMLASGLEYLGMWASRLTPRFVDIFFRYFTTPDTLADVEMLALRNHTAPKDER